MPTLRRTIAAAVVIATTVSGAAVATAGGTTACSLGGPTPGVRALRLDLPNGAADVTIRLRPAAQTGKRLVEGVFLLRAGTHRLVAFRISVNGIAPTRTVVRAGDMSVLDAAYGGPAVPFTRTAGTPVPGLRPGTYYVVGFGTGTSTRTQWGAEVAVDGDHTCTVVGRGTVFDRDASQSRSGTVVTTPGASSADGAVVHWRTSRPLVVGVMQATQEFAGSASLAYRTPTGRGTISDDVAPFVSTAGRYRWVADADAPFAALAVAGAAISLPDTTRTPR